MVERTPLYIPYSDLYYLSSVMRQTEVHLEKKVLKQSSAINFQKQSLHSLVIPGFSFVPKALS